MEDEEKEEEEEEEEDEEEGVGSEVGRGICEMSESVKVLLNET